MKMMTAPFSTVYKKRGGNCFRVDIQHPSYFSTDNCGLLLVFNFVYSSFSCPSD